MALQEISGKMIEFDADGHIINLRNGTKTLLKNSLSSKVFPNLQSGTGLS
jgi:hypothetical protein